MSEAVREPGGGGGGGVGGEPLCVELRNFPGDVRARIAGPVAVSYAMKILSGGGEPLERLSIASLVLDAAIRRYNAPVQDLYGRVRAFLELNNSLSLLASSLQGSASVGDAIAAIDRALSYSQYLGSGEVALLVDYKRFLVSLVSSGVLDAARELSSKASSVQSLIDSVRGKQEVSREDVDALFSAARELSSKAGELVNRYNAFLSSVSGVGRSDVSKNLIKNVLGQIAQHISAVADGARSVASVAESYGELLRTVGAISDGFRAIGKVLSEYDPQTGNTPANPNYAQRLEGFIYAILALTKNVLLGGLGGSAIGEAARRIANEVVRNLYDLKAGLAQQDPRFVGVFEAAEKRAGYSLGAVNVPSRSPLEVAAEAINNIVERGRAFISFSDANLLAKGIVFIANVVLQTLASPVYIALAIEKAIQRPPSINAADIVNAVRDMAKGGWVKAVSEAAAGLARSLCGSPLTCAETAASIAVSFLIPLGLSRLGVAAAARNLVNALVFQDISAMARLVANPRVLNSLRMSVDWLVGQGVRVESKVLNPERFLESFRKYVFSKVGEAPYLARAIKAVEADVKEVAKNVRAVEKAAEEAKKVVMNGALQEMRERLSRLMGFVNDTLRPRIDVGAVERAYEDVWATPLQLYRKDHIAVSGQSVRISASVEVKAAPPHIGRIPARVPLAAPPAIASLSPAAVAEFLRGALESVKALESLEAVIPSKMAREFMEKIGGVKARIGDVQQLLYKYETLKREIAKAVEKPAVAAEAPKAGAAVEKPAAEAQLERLASVLRTYGYDDLAEKLLKVGVGGMDEVVGEAVSRASRELGSALRDIYSSVKRVAGELMRDPSVGELVKRVLYNVEEKISLKAPEIAVGGAVAQYLKKVVEGLRLEGVVDPELRGVLEKLRGIAYKDRMSLADLARFSDILASYSPRLAGLVDLGAVTDLLKSVKVLGQEFGQIESVGKVLGQVEKRLEEAVNAMSRRVPAFTREVVEELRGVSQAFRDNVARISAALNEVSPEGSSRLLNAVEVFEKALEAGDAASVKAAAKQLLSELREASKVLVGAGAIQSPVKRAFTDLVSRLKRFFGAEAAEKPLADVADEILAQLSKIPEIGEGWGFVDIALAREVGIPLVAPKEYAEALRKLLTSGRRVVEVEVGGQKIAVAREVSLDPATRTLRVSFTFTWPGDRRAVIELSIRTVGAGGGAVERVVERFVYVDPSLQRALEDYTAGRVSSELYNVGRSLAEVVRDASEVVFKAFPEARLLERLAVVTQGGVDSLLDELGRLFAGFAAAFAVSTAMSRFLSGESSADVVASVVAIPDKGDALRVVKELERLAAQPSEELVSLLKGYSVVGVVDGAPYAVSQVLSDVVSAIDRVAKMVSGDQAERLEEIKKILSSLDVSKGLDVRRAIPDAMNRLSELMQSLPPPSAVVEEIRGVLEKLQRISNIYMSMPLVALVLPISIPKIEKPVGSARVEVPGVGSVFSLLIPAKIEGVDRLVAVVPIPSMAQVPLEQLELARRRLEASVPVLTTITIQTQVPAVQAPQQGQTPAPSPAPSPGGSGIPAAVFIVPSGAAQLGGVGGGSQAQGRGRQREVLTILQPA